MRLGRRPHQRAGYLCDTAGDLEPAPTKVDTTDGQCGQLAEPKSSEGENGDREIVSSVSPGHWNRRRVRPPRSVLFLLSRAWGRRVCPRR